MTFGEKVRESSYQSDMARPIEPNDLAIGRRILRARKAAGITQSDLAAKAGVTRGAVGNWETGKGISKENLAVVASILRVSFDQLFGSDNVSEPANIEEIKPIKLPDGVPLVGIVEAGVFRTVELSDGSKCEEIPAARDPRYPSARHMAFRVQGDSMDAAGIMPGDILIAVDWVDAGSPIRGGLLAIVERTTDNGRMKELSVKEMQPGREGIELVPRSATSKRESLFAPYDQAGEHTTVKIIGLVVRRLAIYEI